MKYICELCNYKTDDSGNFSHHKKSKRHFKKINEIAKSDKIIDKNVQFTVNILPSNPNCENNSDELSDISYIKNKLVCNYCDIYFTRQSALTQHMKTCSGKSVSKIKEEKNKYKKLLEEKDKIIAEINKENDNIKDRYEDKVFLLEQQIEILKDFAYGANSIAQQLVSSITYLNNNHNDDPISQHFH